jgi:hypothetical protein
VSQVSAEEDIISAIGVSCDQIKFCSSVKQLADGSQYMCFSRVQMVKNVKLPVSGRDLQVDDTRRAESSEIKMRRHRPSNLQLQPQQILPSFFTSEV